MANPALSSFRGRRPATLQPEVVPFDTSLLSSPHPLGDWLLVRGIYIPEDPRDGALKKLNQRIAHIRTLASGDLKHTLLLTASVASKGGYSTSCTVRLDPVHGPENGEPRVDLLQLWATAIQDESPFWEVCWAPQADVARDKRMWVRVNDVFQSRKDFAVDAQVISELRVGADLAGFQTMDGYRLGSSKHAMLALAKPMELDYLLNKGSLYLDGFPRLDVRPGGRQIEAHAPFEIIVGGFLSNEDTGAFGACRSWFASFGRNGKSTLVETRTVPAEPDFVIYTMLDWAATAQILHCIDEFQHNLGSIFNLSPPTLLYRFNGGTNKPSAHSAVAGADAIDSMLAAVVAAEEENRCNMLLARFVNDEYSARREFTYPVNGADKVAAESKINTLKRQPATVDEKLADIQAPAMGPSSAGAQYKRRRVSGSDGAASDLNYNQAAENDIPVRVAVGPFPSCPGII
ncbi:hypothetical protein DFH06DRAFT_1321199 [Mycena polygramma]|nr:hypothetical protein DFH06DRAFT_1331417 [Mycena polygramma]KAJ7669172.1 hypothetical protein DFH06DRAFT_1321199 [Mycena polygramma]